jgi:hypothetical protein
MRRTAIALGLAAAAAVPPAVARAAWPAAPQAQTSADGSSGAAADPSDGAAAPASAFAMAREVSGSRLGADLAAVQSHRPSYPFWQHVFTIPDGRIAYGSARDGRLLAVFPATGDWAAGARWEDPALAGVLDGRPLPRRLDQRRDLVARLIEAAAGPVVHNPTRGRFVGPHAEVYGNFLSEWGGIYDRFGVPAEIGLAQAMIESGLNGRARSRARALGFCQWLSRNWAVLDRLSPAVLEAYNQTTQAPYCAAYLSILATMYGSFIPALSEHHAGGVNVGRTLINGERLGGADARERYFLGSDFAASLRDVSIRRYRDLFRTYGPRSAVYAEMVFGNLVNVQRLIEARQQTRIFAMRTPRAIAIGEITKKTGLPAAEVKRFNPALGTRVPARATLYLPSYVPEFGRDVSFWHRPADPRFAAALDEFLRIDVPVQRWHEASFETTLRTFQDRFENTASEEGSVMATTLAYVIGDLRTSRRAAILEDFRTSGRILELFRRGVEEIGATIRGL